MMELVSIPVASPPTLKFAMSFSGAAPRRDAGGRRSHCVSASPEELEGELRLLVGLGEDADTGLLEDVGAGHGRGLLGDVDVLDAAVGGREGLGERLDVADGALEPVAGGAEGGA